ncbi:uncharacterized protein F4807DRAFT_246352 [Annulohypoxylon truncatum]|uniref:uncharacterized protein n=1 Tax=Annulohypoxylon truncatum TaxID=327061 RepID=UPI002007D4BA|nr:uncharacterized protein F4807DRAFT_246352 [Annulohypoxylon truncatum]KAI1205907.1 hypothetical protein F4807DRAFT_246352 [Annulohypoxylon truncatum]
MVLLARSLSSCCTRPVSTRAFSTATAAARSVSNARPLGAGLTSRSAPAFKSPLFHHPPSPRIPATTRLLTTKREKVKVLAVLYDGGIHAQQVPDLLGTTENELGIRKWLEDQGHTLVTTSDKEGENSTFDKELVDAEIIITTPYVTYYPIPSIPALPPSYAEIEEKN